MEKTKTAAEHAYQLGSGFLEYFKCKVWKT